MKKLSSQTLLKIAAAPTVLGLALLSSAAFAQDPQTADDDSTGEAIIVTGSRIATPNLEAANPIAVVQGEQLFETGGVSIGDDLNNLPQLRSTYSQQNSTRNLGNRGLNLLDLRGLGTARTLVLVNGRRHVGSDVLLNGVSVDINTIPTALVDRVDIVTGGASAVYGSDAVAGVVNFILKDDFEGVEGRAQTGISQYGDAANRYIGAVAGKNFADGRGNVTVDLAYAFTDRYLASNRPNLRQADAFVVVDTDPAGSTNGSDGVFDRQFLRDVRSTTISNGGQFGLAQSRTNARCGADSLGNPFTCSWLFQPDGTLIPQTGTRVGLGPNGNFLGGNGYSGREGELIALTPQVKRFSANLMAHYEISPALVPFIEAKYVRSDALGSQSGPFFNQGTGSVENSSVQLGYNRERIRLDNPFLTPATRTLLTQQILTAGVDPNSTATTPATLTAAQINEINNGSFRLALRRNFVELGIRDEKFRRETYRIVGGIKGQFNDDWTYELSLNYGQHKERNQIQNNVSRQRYLLAIDTARDSNGNIVCRSKLSAANTGTDRAGNAAQLAADVAACVPLNPFGDGNISQAAKDYLRVSTEATGKITQFDILGYVAGDTSQFLNLPGGPIGFSVGGEYRRETISYKLDPYTQAGYAFYNAIPTLSAPSFEVKEAYGELRAPLLADVPFFHELTLKGSGRVADYKGSTGTVYAYGGEAIWSPVSDITFRGTYARSVRAPTLSDLYSAQSQNFTPAPNDPCSARNIATGSSTRSANCTAAGRPANYDYVYTSSLEITSGGNPNLEAETSDSYTAGGILQPRWIPGLSVSADYYDITVNNVITATGTPQTILNLCYDSPTLNNPFCSLFQRAGASGGPNGEIPFQVISRSLLQSTANFAKLKVRGLDAEVRYRHTFGFGTLSLSAMWNHQFQNDSFTNPSDPTFADAFVGELNDPEDQVNYDAKLKTGKWSFGYGLTWIAGMYLNTNEDYNSVNGLPPQNTDYATIEKYPSVWYHDAYVGYDVTDQFYLYAGVDNFTDRTPPYGLTGVGAGSGIYDVRGRYFYGGVKVKF